MIRPATDKDYDALYDVLEKFCALYPLRPDHERMGSLLTEAIAEGRHFSMVVEQDEELRGALLAYSGRNFWAQRNFCNVVLWYSELPGEGRELLRRFKKWALGRRTSIRVAGFTPDIDVDPRAWLLAERVGFARHGGAYLLYT